MTRRAIAWMDAQGWPWIVIVLAGAGNADNIVDGILWLTTL